MNDIVLGMPRSPLLSSHTAGWHGIHLEHHRQPAHSLPEAAFPLHAIDIGLRYEAPEINVNGRIYRGHYPGNIALCPADTSISTESYGEAEFLVLALDPNLLTVATDHHLDSSQIELRSQLTGQDPLIFHMALALKQSLKQAGPDSALYAESMATALAAHLVQNYGVQTHRQQPASGGLSARELQGAIAYIQAHLDQSLSLADLAATVPMSAHHFATRFKQSTGLPPHQYITRCRIERAQKLLTQPELSIINICHRVGFRSQSHFTQVFRKHTSVTPKRYRKLL